MFKESLFFSSSRWHPAAAERARNMVDDVITHRYLPPWDPTLFIGDGAGSDGGSSYNSGQSDNDDTTTQHISTSSISSPLNSTTSATSRTGGKEKKKTNKKKSKQSVRKSQIGAPVHFRHVEHGKTPEEEMFMASDGHQGSSQWTIQGR